MNFKIERPFKGSMHIRMTNPSGQFLETQSIEANLLFSILEKLGELRDDLIDIQKKIIER